MSIIIFQAIADRQFPYRKNTDSWGQKNSLLDKNTEYLIKTQKLLKNVDIFQIFSLLDDKKIQLQKTEWPIYYCKIGGGWV